MASSLRRRFNPTASTIAGVSGVGLQNGGAFIARPAAGVRTPSTPRGRSAHGSPGVLGAKGPTVATPVVVEASDVSGFAIEGLVTRAGAVMAQRRLGTSIIISGTSVQILTLIGWAGHGLGLSSVSDGTGFPYSLAHTVEGWAAAGEGIGGSTPTAWRVCEIASAIVAMAEVPSNSCFISRPSGRVVRVRALLVASGVSRDDCRREVSTKILTVSIPSVRAACGVFQYKTEPLRHFCKWKEIAQAVRAMGIIPLAKGRDVRCLMRARRPKSRASGARKIAEAPATATPVLMGRTGRSSARSPSSDVALTMGSWPALWGTAPGRP